MKIQNLIEAIRRQFSSQAAIPKAELIKFLRPYYEDAKVSTLNWRLHELTQAGVLIRTGYGLYALNNRLAFSPTLSPVLRKISDRVKTELPFIDCCVWDSRMIADLMIQQPISFIQLVEVDRVAVSSVYQLLLNHPVLVNRKSPSVYLYDDWLTLRRSRMSHAPPVIIKPIISEAPLQQQEPYTMAPLEKILVDLIADEELFFAYQEELSYILRSAFGKYVINRDKLRRYARRRNRADQVEQTLSQLPTTYY